MSSTKLALYAPCRGTLYPQLCPACGKIGSIKDVCLECSSVEDLAKFLVGPWTDHRVRRLRVTFRGGAFHATLHRDGSDARRLDCMKASGRELARALRQLAVYVQLGAWRERAAPVPTMHYGAYEP